MELWEEDLYELIGVEPEASQEEIKKAYKKLAISLHPDRFPNDEEKRAEAQAQFGKITNAYNILKDEEQRSEYDFARRMGFATNGDGTGGTGKISVDENAVNDAKKSQAQNQFDQGKVYHRGKNYQKAISCYKEAVRLDPSVADYHAHLGLAYFQQGLKTPANNAFAAAHKLDKRNKILAQYYTAPGANGKKGGKKGASDKPGLLEQLMALFSSGKDAKGGKKGAPAKKKGTAPLKKAGAKK